MKRILVPLDGSELAERALEPALHLAARHGAEVHLASVIADFSPPTALDAVELVTQWLNDREARAQKYLVGVRDRLSSRWSSVSIDAHVAVGPVAHTLREFALQLKADLVVLTTHGRGRWKRAWLGSVADQLVRSSPVPLLLLRGSEDTDGLFGREGSPKHVFVPLDGSKAAEAVLGALADILPRSGSRVTVAAVLHRSVMPFSVDLPETVSERPLLETDRARLTSYLKGMENQLRSQGVAVAGARLIEAMDVARSLLDACEGSNADLIALSTHGRGAAARLLLGSVADKLIRGSELPILIVRGPETQGAG